MGGATDVVHRRCGRRPCEEMDDRVVEELRAFISQRYSSFMTSTLTFRHLKQHLSDTLGLPYGMFSLPDGRYADTLDDEVDAIAVRCDGGARDVECVPTRLRDAETAPACAPRRGPGVLVLAVALFRTAATTRVDKHFSVSFVSANETYYALRDRARVRETSPLDRAGISGARRLPLPAFHMRQRYTPDTVEFPLSAPPAATPTHATRIARSIVPRHKPATPDKSSEGRSKRWYECSGSPQDDPAGSIEGC